MSNKFFLSLALLLSTCSSFAESQSEADLEMGHITRIYQCTVVDYDGLSHKGGEFWNDKPAAEQDAAKTCRDYYRKDSKWVCNNGYRKSLTCELSYETNGD